MTRIPDAAITHIAAALDDYRLTTPTHTQNPHDAAHAIATQLLTAGWSIYIPRTPPPTLRVPCPHCTVHHLVTTKGRIRRHGPHGHPCPGSGTPARNALTTTHPTTTPTQPNERRPA
ncbi:hypothetical protein [Streptomyces fumanus]|uniref:hypothetical protein n=1 Tax=Streptomyces fumanus TaxID=67302 RepID=UPI0034055527